MTRSTAKLRVQALSKILLRDLRNLARSFDEEVGMNKKRSVKKLALGRETLRQLEPDDLHKAQGQGSWESDCAFTCGPNSCLGVCSLNCTWVYPFGSTT